MLRRFLMLAALLLCAGLSRAGDAEDIGPLPLMSPQVLAQIIVITPATVIDFQGLANSPGNPPTGKGRVYFNSSTGQLTCITSTGASCNGGGSSAGAFQNATYVGPKCAVGNANQCFFANFDLQYAYSVTCNSTTTIVTGTNDPPFVPGDVGKIIVGLQGAGTTANCPPQTTITGFTDSHTVTVNNAATVTGSGGALGWGSNDGAQIASAFQASLGKGCLFLAGPAAFFDVPPFLDTRSNGATIGPVDCVIGSNTTLTPLQTFNYSNCVTNGACIFVWPNGAFANPNYAVLKDFTILGIGRGYTLTGSGTNNFVLNLQRVSLDNVWVWHWGASIGIGADMTGPMSAWDMNIDSTGSIANCAIAGTGANQTVTLYSTFCGEGAQSLSIGSGSSLATYGGQWGPGGAPNITASGNWTSYGDVIFAATSANADSLRVSGTGNVVLDSTQVIGGTGNTFGALNCNASGGVVELRGNISIAGGASGGVPIHSASGCTIIDHAQKITITGGSNSLSGNWFGTSSASGTPLVTGNIGLTSGWGTSSVASVAANSDSRRGSFTITGAAGSANPTLTLTFPTPFIVAPPSCTLWFGSSGATTDFTNVFASAPSTTSVVFNLIGTPTAVSIVFDYSCGG